MNTLVDRIVAQGAALAERPSAEMYQNPFWQDRFGARGRELLEKHLALHVDHLVQALAVADASLFLDYARKLRAELTSAGMCSRYIDESFERLDGAIAGLVPDSGPARELVRAARRALVYESGPARELQHLSEPLAERTLDGLWSRQTGWFAAASSYVSLASLESITQAERARWKGDVLELLSFLADALHTGRPEAFCAYAVWVRDFFVRRHAPAGRMEETLRVLAECFPLARGASVAERPTAPLPMPASPPAMTSRSSLASRPHRCPSRPRRPCLCRYRPSSPRVRARSSGPRSSAWPSNRRLPWRLDPARSSSAAPAFTACDAAPSDGRSPSMSGCAWRPQRARRVPRQRPPDRARARTVRSPRRAP